MESLHQLLAKEGFEHRKSSKSHKKVKFKDKVSPDVSIALPIYICLDRKIHEFSRQRSSEKAFSRNGSSVFSSRRGGSVSGISNTRSMPEGVPSRSHKPAIDEVAVRAVISILGGYVGQYLRDGDFRETMRIKCFSCVSRRNNDSTKGVLVNFMMGVESIEMLVDDHVTKKEVKLQSLQDSIRLLSIVASLNSKASRNGTILANPNSNLSACTQLYLSIVYKLEKNDRVSARHLLQVFCDSPFVARTHLLPELWEHLFLPHLLHLKIWQSKQLEFLSNSDCDDKEKRMKALSKVYNDQMDKGTAQFALYYKQWLKVGAQTPSVPYVPLPSIPSYENSRRKSSDSFTTNSSTKKTLYQTLFGSNMRRHSMDDGESGKIWGSEKEEKACRNGDNSSPNGYFESRTKTHSRSSSRSFRNPRAESRPEVKKSSDFLFLQVEPTECLVQSYSIGSNKKKITPHDVLPSSELRTAIATISSSETLSNCEMAIHQIAKAWLDSHGDSTVEALLLETPVLEGILEVLLASEDDVVLELAVSILAELVTRKEMYGHVILNSDPQLNIFRRLLRNNIFFLKAAALLYLLRPKAKQMISMDWIPLVLRVLEFGDQSQTFFTVRCSPQVAAYYFLDQLLTGFDEDKNFDNARQVVTLGGLRLLARRMKTGDMAEKNKAVSIIYCCILADGGCRHYLVNNLNMDSIIELLAMRKQSDAFALLAELLCLQRRTQITKFLNGLLSGWGSLNTMHILLSHLQTATAEKRPMAAALLLQLDLLGDPLKSSVYREEAVEAVVSALDSQMCNEEVQEQSARALLVLGGRFTYTGKPATERCLLKEAGFDDSSSAESLHGKDLIFDRFIRLNEEDEETKNWQRKTAMVLLTRGNKRFLAALSYSAANGIPCLARASLVTVSWLSIYLYEVGDENLMSMACSVLVPQLVECLNHDKAPEERVLASFSLLNLTRSSECVLKMLKLSKEQMGSIRNLSNATWTARDLISIITSRRNSRNLST